MGVTQQGFLKGQVVAADVNWITLYPLEQWNGEVG